MKKFSFLYFLESHRGFTRINKQAHEILVLIKETSSNGSEDDCPFAPVLPELFCQAARLECVMDFVSYFSTKTYVVLSGGLLYSYLISTTTSSKYSISIMNLYIHEHERDPYPSYVLC